MNVLIIDGQGGKLGRQLSEAIKERVPGCTITAVGTNSTATANMLKGGADRAATGENSVIVCSRTADVIVGPVGIVIADSLLGEITPAMATAIGQSNAEKVLVPVNKCGHIVIGAGDQSLSELVRQAGDYIAELDQKYQGAR